MTLIQSRYTSEEPSWQLKAGLIVVTSLFCLHLLRNVWVGFPLLAWAGAIFTVIRYRSAKGFDRLGKALCALLGFSIFYTIVISFIKYPDQAYVPALMRLLFIVPYLVFVATVVDDRRKLTLILQTFSFWIAMSAVTVFYQALLGPIDWFALPTVRNGTLRYASLVGNLTALGFVGGLALPFCYFLFKNPVAQGSMVAIVMLGLILSLQKSAILNIFIFLIFILLLRVFRFHNCRHTSIFSVFVFAAIFVLWSTVFTIIEPKGGALNAVDTLHGTRSDLITSRVSHTEHYRPILKAAFETYFSKEQVPAAEPKVFTMNTDVAMRQGLVDRFFTLPLKLINQYEPTSLLTGVGLVGASGSLGFLETICDNPQDIHTCRLKYPMAHNAAVEFLVMGGLPLFLSFSLFIFFAALRIAKAWRCNPCGKLESAISIAMLIFLPNAMTSSGIIVQPYIAGILYSICVPILLRPGILVTRT